MACLSQAVLVTWWVARDGGRYWREEGSGRGSLGTKETRVNRGMVVGMVQEFFIKINIHVTLYLGQGYSTFDKHRNDRNVMPWNILGKNWAGKLVPMVLHGGKAKILFLDEVVPRILKGQMLGSAISSTVVVMGAIGAMLFGMFVMCAIDCRGKNSDIADARV